MCRSTPAGAFVRAKATASKKPTGANSRMTMPRASWAFTNEVGGGGRAIFCDGGRRASSGQISESNAAIRPQRACSAAWLLMVAISHGTARPTSASRDALFTSYRWSSARLSFAQPAPVALGCAAPKCTIKTGFPRQFFAAYGPNSWLFAIRPIERDQS